MEVPPAPGHSTFSGAGGGVGEGVGLASTGLELGLDVAVICVGLGDWERAAIEPGEAPTLQALKSATSEKSPANRPIEG